MQWNTQRHILLCKLYHEYKCCKCNKDAQQFAFVEKRNKCLLATRDDSVPCFRSCYASMILKNIESIFHYIKRGLKSTQS